MGTPLWFQLAEETTPEVMRRVAQSVSDLQMSPQVRSAPMLAHWFLLDGLLIAHGANRDGMHANPLAVTRQCVEAIGVIELGVCRHPDAEETLLKWDDDKLTPGKLRAWLEANVWTFYGSGLWQEPWSIFMREFTSAIQPYAHYTRNLAQWQTRLIRAPWQVERDALSAIIELTPRAYDAQKATRITLFHALLTYFLARIWAASNADDLEFVALTNRLGVALRDSKYLDGKDTCWGQQFWAMLWEKGGGTILE